MAALLRILDVLSDDWRLPEPPRWNGPVKRVLRVHPDTIELTRLAFAATARRGLECGLFWYGTVTETEAMVLGIVVPTQINSRGHYELPESAVDQLSDATRPRGWFNLAQVHTHPSHWVGHSRYDDYYANSRNALSLVFPCYGRIPMSWSASVGVHEFLDGQWQRLADECVARRIVFDAKLPVPEVMDLRLIQQRRPSPRP